MREVWRTTEKTKKISEKRKYWLHRVSDFLEIIGGKILFSVFPFFSVFSVVIHFNLFANLGILMISKEVLHG